MRISGLTDGVRGGVRQHAAHVRDVERLQCARAPHDVAKSLVRETCKRHGTASGRHSAGSSKKGAIRSVRRVVDHVSKFMASALRLFVRRSMDASVNDWNRTEFGICGQLSQTTWKCTVPFGAETSAASPALLPLNRHSSRRYFDLMSKLPDKIVGGQLQRSAARVHTGNAVKV